MIPVKLKMKNELTANNEVSSSVKMNDSFIKMRKTTLNWFISRKFWIKHLNIKKMLSNKNIYLTTFFN